MSSLVITAVVKASGGLEINHVVTLRLSAHSPLTLHSVIMKNHMVSCVKLLVVVCFKNDIMNHTAGNSVTT